ncbi:MAG: cyclic pyranopterin monophosphate synthase MoaC [Bacteroidota bacterium]
MENHLSHINPEGHPTMVDVSEKAATRRTARARATVRVGEQIAHHLRALQHNMAKGAVFHTASVAGVMAAKKTADLIPLCHPLGLDDCQVHLSLQEDKVVIDSLAVLTGKTGVEMEALTAATVAALTVYDMCKAMSHQIVIEEVVLLEKTGGKQDFRRTGL